MRRKIIAITALVCLVAAGAAYGATAFNTYKANYAFHGKAGSKKKPAPIGVHLTYTAANANHSDRAWPLVDIKSGWQNVKVNWKAFPTCKASQMANASAGYNKACPKGSLVATGIVKSVIGPAGNMSNNAIGVFPCKLTLDVYNSGRGVLTYFFVIAKYGDCGALQTGAAAPYTAKTSMSRGMLVENVPLPADVSTAAGGISGFYGSLEYESLTFKKMVRKYHGKKVPFLASTGCVKHKRNWWVKFTATNGSTKQSKMIRGKAKC